MPSAYEMEEIHAFKGAVGGNTVEIHAVDDKPFVAHVFKTYAEPHIGDVSFFRIFQGIVGNGQEVYNATRDGAEKVNHLSVPLGKERIEVPMLHAGDIGCVAKLRNTHTNDTLSSKDFPVRLPSIRFPEPVVSFAVRAAARHDEEKLQTGLHRLHDEDPTFETHYNAETHETLISGVGERHVEIAMSRLKRKFGVGVELSKPKIAYRETILGKGDGQGRHKKQTGGRGQFGDCWMRMKPRPRGAGLLSSKTKSWAGRSRRSSFPPSIRGFRKRLFAAFSPGVRSSTSRWSCTTARITPSTRTKCRSRWPASRRSSRSHRSASRCCSSRSTK